MIKIATNQKDYFSIINLRAKVFCIEQNIDVKDEIDEIDKEDTTVHIIAYDHDIAIGTISYVQEDINTYRLRRLCVLKAYRNRGIAKNLIAFAEDLIAKNNHSTIIINAQIQLENYYAKLGYTSTEVKFYEANILHVKMIKKV